MVFRRRLHEAGSLGHRGEVLCCVLPPPTNLPSVSRILVLFAWGMRVILQSIPQKRKRQVYKAHLLGCAFIPFIQCNTIQNHTRFSSFMAWLPVDLLLFLFDDPITLGRLDGRNSAQAKRAPPRVAPLRDRRLVPGSDGASRARLRAVFRRQPAAGTIDQGPGVRTRW